MNHQGREAPSDRPRGCRWASHPALAAWRVPRRCGRVRGLLGSESARCLRSWTSRADDAGNLFPGLASDLRVEWTVKMQKLGLDLCGDPLPRDRPAKDHAEDENGTDHDRHWRFLILDSINFVDVCWHRNRPEPAPLLGSRFNSPGIARH